MIALLKRIVPRRLHPRAYLCNLTEKRCAQRVFSGPFAGMRYIHARGSGFHPVMLGTYEKELHPVLERELALERDLMVDVGAGEGYYAVGFARFGRVARVVAFEENPQVREVLAETTRLNQVSARIELRGRCEPADLQAALARAERPLVKCDVEGYETTLLDPQAVPALRRSAILVETHDFIRPGITAELTRRFDLTHAIERIDTRERLPHEFPFRTWYVRAMPRRYQTYAMFEYRPAPMSWLVMAPRG